MKRKALVWLVAIIMLACLSWFACRIPYHRWRLVACTKTAERLRLGQYTKADEFLGLFHREPKTYRDYEDAAMRHEDALVKLGYLARKEFHLRNPIRSDTHFAELMQRAVKSFPDTNRWSLILSPTGDVVRVTTLPNRIDDWKAFIQDFERARSSKKDDSRECRGSRKRRSISYRPNSRLTARLSD